MGVMAVMAAMVFLCRNTVIGDMGRGDVGLGDDDRRETKGRCRSGSIICSDGVLLGCGLAVAAAGAEGVGWVRGEGGFVSATDAPAGCSDFTTERAAVGWPDLGADDAID